MRVIAMGAVAAMSCAVVPALAADLPRQQAGVDCIAYGLAPVSVAISKPKAAILANSRFNAPNRFRAELSPHHYAFVYKWVRDCDPALLRDRKAKRR